MDLKNAPNSKYSRLGSLRITTKFGLAFALLLVILLTEMIIGFAALSDVWEANNSILSSVEIQRLVSGMRQNWETTQRLQQSFFRQSPIIGTDQAYQLYALPAGGKISEIVRDGASLSRLISTLEEDNRLRERESDLKEYLAAVSQYATAFEEATELEYQLACIGTGLQTTLEQKAEVLFTILQATAEPDELLSDFYEARFIEKDYLSIREDFSIRAFFDSTARLRQAVENSGMDGSTLESALLALEEYKNAAGDVFVSGDEIHQKLTLLDSLGESIEPNLVTLMVSVDTEVARANQQIAETRQRARTLLIAALIIGLVSVLLIAVMLHNNVTRNVIKLTRVAAQFHEGNLAARAEINSGDELGQLGETFNDMAADLSQTIDQLEILQDGSLELAREFDINNVVTKAMYTTMRLSCADAGYICLSEGDELILAQVFGPYTSPLIGTRLPTGKGILAQAAQRKKTRLVLDQPPEPGEVSLNQRSRARIAIPLVAAQQLFGVLYLEAQEKECFSTDTIKFLNLFAIRTAVAVQNARLFTEAQRLAIEDPLTGLYNRRGLFKISQREISRALRFKRPLSLLFIDIDHFKEFNDRYSYEVGDRVLQIISSCMQGNVRDVDLVSRYGGEEFVILLPEMDRLDALRAAERLRETIAAETVQAEGDAVAVTVSIGVGALETKIDTGYLGPTREESILHELIDKAGRMLHVAKASGRNRVIVDEDVTLK